MKTFDEIRIDLIIIADKLDLVCKAHRDSGCETCPLNINERKPNGFSFEYSCALMLLGNDIDYYFDNINDIADYFRSEED